MFSSLQSLVVSCKLQSLVVEDQNIIDALLSLQIGKISNTGRWDYFFEDRNSILVPLLEV